MDNRKGPCNPNKNSQVWAKGANIEAEDKYSISQMFEIEK
jgi:hypothetical protein